jgi:glutamyl-Q tRNA(Asp) synthetase
MSHYIGRFAPSPTGPLHAGSLVAALASWLDAKAHQGTWFIRIEDVDYIRCKTEFTEIILSQLLTLGLHSDLPICYQSQRSKAYQNALDCLIQQGWAYPCGCTRKFMQNTPTGIYPGTCRHGLNGLPARNWRVRTGLNHKPIAIQWDDRNLGAQTQNITQEVGDFVLRRADGPWAYQLAVVVDDAAQGVTHIVRGEDLADNTSRQWHLQNLLGFPHPEYLHTPLVWAEDGQKLSKQTGAKPLDITQPIACLNAAIDVLNLPQPSTEHIPTWLHQATGIWAEKFKLKPR